MNPEELRAIMEFLRQRGRIGDTTSGSASIEFDTPSLADMQAAGLDPQGSQGVLDAPWWDEMVDDVLETPEVCEPDDTPDQVLEYARDVVSEYIRKRFTL